jgi:hypothetical protein
MLIYDRCCISYQIKIHLTCSYSFHYLFKYLTTIHVSDKYVVLDYVRCSLLRPSRAVLRINNNKKKSKSNYIIQLQQLLNKRIKTP